MRIARAGGVQGAATARGMVVVIDVLRAFTVAAYAIAGGAREVIFVPALDEARRVAAAIPGALLSAEVDGYPVPGVPISNSPTMMAREDLRERVLVQRSSAGVQALAAAAETAERLMAASLVVAAATARYITDLSPELVTLVPSRIDHQEDGACADYLEGLLTGHRLDLDRLLEPVRASGRYGRQIRDEWPGFPPTDLDLSLTADTFDFALPVERGEHGHLRIRPASG